MSKKQTVEYYAVVVGDRKTRVFAHHPMPDIIFQAYMTLSPQTREQAVVVAAASPESAKSLAEAALNVAR